MEKSIFMLSEAYVTVCLDCGGIVEIMVENGTGTRKGQLPDLLGWLNFKHLVKKEKGFKAIDDETLALVEIVPVEIDGFVLGGLKRIGDGRQRLIAEKEFRYWQKLGETQSLALNI